MNTETRRKLEKNGFVISIFLGGLALISWTRIMFEQYVKFVIPIVNIDLATVIGIVLIYTGIRYLQHRI